jgi:hypothetical protein
MAISGGLAWTTMSVDTVGGVLTDVRNDCTNLQFATPRAASDVTGLDVQAIERILLLADFTVTLNGQYNPTGVHQVLKTVTSTAVLRSTAMTVNGATLNNEVLYTDYTVVRAQGGDLNWSAAGSLADGTVPTWA